MRARRRPEAGRGIGTERSIGDYITLEDVAAILAT